MPSVCLWLPRKKGEVIPMIKYTVEYSVEQSCFHIERLKLTLERNLMDMFDGNSNDYKVIAICDDYDEASNFVKNCKKAMENIKE